MKKAKPKKPYTPPSSKRPATKRAVEKAAPKPEHVLKSLGVEADVPSDDREKIKKKAFLERAVERSGVKKKDAKPAIEAALALLGEMLVDGEELNLPPLGKLKVNRSKDLPKAKILIVKLRVPNNMNGIEADAEGSVSPSADAQK